MLAGFGNYTGARVAAALVHHQAHHHGCKVSSSTHTVAFALEHLGNTAERTMQNSGSSMPRRSYCHSLASVKLELEMMAGTSPVLAFSLHHTGSPTVKCRQRVPAAPRLRKNQVAVTTAVLDTGSSPSGDAGNSRATRLGRIIQKRQRQLVQKLNDVRNGLPMKIFLLLLGFYSANALATVLGQTGDWDVLAAGVMVAVIEGIGYVLYRNPPVGQTLQYVFKMINYWKAGFSFGLFVDAFKLGS